MWGRTFLDEIRRLDPERDYRRIAFIDTCHEFPWDMARALEFALVRSFAVPRISALLDHTGEFVQRTQRRYDDTDLILSEILEHGFDSDRGRDAIRRLNVLHGRFSIENEDFLYVMSTFIFEPIRWNERFGWRRATEREKLAGYNYWRQLGRYMNIKGIPESIEAFERFNRKYERDHFRFAESNRRVADANFDLVLSRVLPRPLRKLGRPFLYALMDHPLRDAFGYPKPPRALRWGVETSLKARARLVRWLPERREPLLRTRLRRPSYPDGYNVGELGPHLLPSTDQTSTPTGT